MQQNIIIVIKINFHSSSLRLRVKLTALEHSDNGCYAPRKSCYENQICYDSENNCKKYLLVLQNSQLVPQKHTSTLNPSVKMGLPLSTNSNIRKNITLKKELSFSATKSQTCILGCLLNNTILQWLVTSWRQTNCLGSQIIQDGQNQAEYIFWKLYYWWLSVEASCLSSSLNHTNQTCNKYIPNKLCSSHVKSS